jgi:hypothetical protein
VAVCTTNGFSVVFQTWEKLAMTTQRPTGVTILAVLQLLGGILSLLVGISSLFFGGLMVSTGAAGQAGAPVQVGPVMLGVGIALLISGMLLLRLKKVSIF